MLSLLRTVQPCVGNSSSGPDHMWDLQPAPASLWASVSLTVGKAGMPFSPLLSYGLPASRPYLLSCSLCLVHPVPPEGRSQILGCSCPLGQGKIGVDRGRRG